MPMSLDRALKATLLSLALALAGCGGGGGASAPAPSAPSQPAPPPPPPPTAPVSVEREILPGQTDPSLPAGSIPHIAINPLPTVPSSGRLFVMLPGTGGTPRTYREIVRLAPSRGRHAIGLDYPNDVAVESLCGSSPDPDCAGRVRREVILGEDTSPLVAVSPANSINGRLRSLLTFLNASAPNEGWGQFLVAGQVDWSRVVIAGHSQGAGHSGFLAKLFALDRVVMFSGPGDTGVAANSSAQWLSLPNVTPASRMFGFTHTADPLLPFANVTRNWGTLGLGAFGPVTSVDGAASPFGNSHQLSTSAPPNPNPQGFSLAPAHGAPVVDAVTPRDASGAPAFIPVWIYLAFP